MIKLKEALLVIDAQKVYSLENSALYVEDYKEVVANINKLIKYYEKNNMPVIYVRHVHSDRSDSGRMFDFTGEQFDVEFLENTAESDYMDELTVISSGKEIIKKRYSSFEGTDLEKILKAEEINCVTITGFMTNYCCETTARQAHDMDYYVNFVIDATSAPALPELSVEEIKKATAANIANGFGIVCNTNSIIK